MVLGSLILVKSFNADLYFTFAQDSLNMTIKHEKSQQGLGAVGITVYVPLKYSRSGDKLQLSGDDKGINVNIDDLKLDDSRQKLLRKFNLSKMRLKLI